MVLQTYSRDGLIFIDDYQFTGYFSMLVYLGRLGDQPLLCKAKP